MERPPRAASHVRHWSEQVQRQSRAQSVSTLFRGRRFYLNTAVIGASSLRQVIFEHGGSVSMAPTGRSNSVIDYLLTPNLPDAKLGKIMPGHHVLRPEWVAACVDAGCLVPEGPFGLRKASNTAPLGFALRAAASEAAAGPAITELEDEVRIIPGTTAHDSGVGLADWSCPAAAGAAASSSEKMPPRAVGFKRRRPEDLLTTAAGDAGSGDSRRSPTVATSAPAAGLEPGSGSVVSGQPLAPAPSRGGGGSGHRRRGGKPFRLGRSWVALAPAAAPVSSVT